MSGPLTPRQTQIMELLIAGKTQDEAAKLLGVARSTIASHLERVRDRLTAMTTVEAVAIYLKQKSS